MASECGDDITQEAAERPIKVLHPLQHKWALWHLKGDRSKKWADCLKRIAVIEYVEDFWGLYLQIVPASLLSLHSDYYFFKDGIKPMWEDPKNTNGGRWTYPIKKLYRSEKLDELWLELMMMLICEKFEDNNEFICGASVCVRAKDDKISLWTKDGSSNSDEINRRIALNFLGTLGLPAVDTFCYERHCNKHSCPTPLAPGMKTFHPTPIQPSTKDSEGNTSLNDK